MIVRTSPLLPTPSELATSIADLARIMDEEFRAAEADLEMELNALGENAEDVRIPLGVVLERLCWFAYKMGVMAGKAH
jgi:hypothetical protein